MLTAASLALLASGIIKTKVNTRYTVCLRIWCFELHGLVEILEVVVAKQVVKTAR